jgi:hypothetical protein
MTSMQMMYLKTRTEQKCGHRAALRIMAAETGIDPDSIDRTLQRARRSDAIDAKRNKKAKAAA